MLPRSLSRFGTYERCALSAVEPLYRITAVKALTCAEFALFIMEVQHRFTACLKGIAEPGTLAFIEVPRLVMRSMRWGRRVRVLATINGHSCHATILNVGFGPSFAVTPRAREATGLKLYESAEISIQEILA